jgi:formylglycine-generating enzyme
VTNRATKAANRGPGSFTVAEREPRHEDHAAAAADLLIPRSLVFEPTPGPVDLRDYRRWSYLRGAS